MEHLGPEEEGMVSEAGMEDDAQLTGGSIHISDVIDVIQMDTERAGNTTGNIMADGGDRRRPAETAYIKILEQPASKALRFRYECEGRSAGSIPGVNSTPETKTYPTIQVVGYKGRAAVVVSCVTKDPPYRPHPHNLVGKEGCKKGVCSLHVSSNNMIISFSNLGIQCVKKKDIEEALRVREEIRIDPFRTGFSHRSHPTGIDLNAVRLCFQVFLEGPEPNTYTRPLAPVVSEPIYDKKAMSDLVICKLSDACASVAGGKEMILLCEKVAKEDIHIRFYEERDGLVVWEALADFQPTHVHKQVAISFRTPRYRMIEVDGPVTAYIQLKRPSDGATSEPLPFQFVPLDSDPVVLKRKRQKYGDDHNAAMVRHFQEAERSRPSYTMSPSPDSLQGSLHLIKKEPSDASPGMYYGGNLSPMYAASGPSPQSAPMHSPQLPVGRTPSPMEYPPPIYAGLQGYSYSQPPFSVGPPTTNVPIPLRSGLLAGGSYTAAASPKPDMARPNSAGISGMTSGVPGGMPGAGHGHGQFQGLIQPVGNIGMGIPPGHLSPVDYVGQPANNPGGPAPPTSMGINGGLPPFTGVDPAPPAPSGPVPSLVELAGPGPLEELKQLNSGDLFQLGPWEGNLSEQMSSNLTLSESGPSTSCKREVGDADATWLQSQN